MIVKYFTNGDINVINTGDNDLSKNFGPTYGDGYECKKAKIATITPCKYDMFNLILNVTNPRTGKLLSFYLCKNNLIKVLNEAEEDRD